MTDNFWSQWFILSSLLPLPKLRDKGLPLLLTGPLVLRKTRSEPLTAKRKICLRCWNKTLKIKSSGTYFSFHPNIQSWVFLPLCPPSAVNISTVRVQTLAKSWLQFAHVYDSAVSRFYCAESRQYEESWFQLSSFLYDAELKRAQVIVTLLRESHQQDAADAEVKKD